MTIVNADVDAFTIYISKFVVLSLQKISHGDTIRTRRLIDVHGGLEARIQRRLAIEHI